MKIATLLAAGALVLVAGCDSKKENAAEVKDAQTGATVGEDSPGMGPAESAADGSATNSAVTEQASDTMQNQADAVRNNAEAVADNMETKADAVREKAEVKADAIEEKS
jgi:PBP1b-binding outer membrane lipoprotein LpoB